MSKIKSEIINMLEFPKSSSLFQSMSTEAPDILLNIEILFKNKLNLDRAYHEPDNFIIESNNIIRNLIFLTEVAKKNKYQWLNDTIETFKEEYNTDYVKLKEFRRLASHTELIISEGTFEFGLYKIMDNISYKLKIGMDNSTGKNKLQLHDVYKDTETIFHKLLMMHYLIFIDIKNRDKFECLGITRKWLAKIKLKNGNNGSKTQVVDIYHLISNYCDKLINCIMHAYGKTNKIEHKEFRLHIASHYNYINTVLELDLYPTLFNKFWKGSFEPLNWKYLVDFNIKKNIDIKRKAIERVYNEIPNSIDAYITLLNKYINVKIEDFGSQDEYNSYMSFISLHHLYMNPLKSKKFIMKVNFENIYALHNLAERYIQEIDLNFETVPNKVKNDFLNEISNILNVIRTNIIENFSSSIKK